MLMPSLNAMAVFARVVDAGSFQRPRASSA